MLAASILLTPGTEVSGRNKAEKTETVAVKTEKTAKTEKTRHAKTNLRFIIKS